MLINLIQKLILLFVFAACTLFVKAQNNNDIGDQIRKSYINTKPNMIMSARLLLLDKFLGQDMLGVKQFTNYITDSLENTNYIGLWTVEKILIYYWLQDYSSVLNQFQKIDSLFQGTNGIAKIPPSEDFLYVKLKEITDNNYINLKNYIDKSNLSDESKAFLNIGLISILLSRSDRVEDQEELNKLSKQFITDFPRSNFNSLVRHYIVEYRPSNWAWGIELFGGYGTFTNDMSKHFKKPIVLGISFDVVYKDFISYFRLGGGFSSVKEDILFLSKGEDYLWTKNSLASMFIAEVGLGYPLFEDKNVKIVPYSLIGGTGITPSSKSRNDYSELKDIEMSSFSYGLGINFDFKLTNREHNSKFTYGATYRSYWCIRLRYSYKLNNFKEFQGNFHYITLGIAGLGRKQIRKEY